MFNLQNKYKTDIKLTFIATSFRDTLRTIYDEADPLYFLPFPTTTAWDAVAHEVAWLNDFNFRYSENSKTQGFDGNIVLEETPSA